MAVTRKTAHFNVLLHLSCKQTLLGKVRRVCLNHLILKFYWMKLTFWGAARQVTGSMYLLELEDGFKILIDCGTDLDQQKMEREKNLGHYSLFPFEPSEINLVLLTHAHIDHSGNLPNLVKDGYEGQILCTTATMPLTDLLLRDSAMLNAKRAKELENAPSAKSKKGRHNKNKKKPFRFNPQELYLEAQVNETADRFVTVGFNQKFKVSKNVNVTFIPTGHLLGAANIVLEIDENGTKKPSASRATLAAKTIRCCLTRNGCRPWTTCSANPRTAAAGTPTRRLPWRLWKR